MIIDMERVHDHRHGAGCLLLTRDQRNHVCGLGLLHNHTGAPARSMSVRAASNSQAYDQIFMRREEVNLSAPSPRRTAWAM
jgi:hypothetical protein